MEKKVDENGEWEVILGTNCQIEVLTKPSQSFLDWQASNPIVEVAPVRDLAIEVDDLKAKVENLEKR